MRYRNINTGAETNQFSEKDWKSGQPQRKGWIETAAHPLKSTPRDIVDFVFKKKPVEEKDRPSLSEKDIDAIIAETGGIVESEKESHKINIPEGFPDLTKSEKMEIQKFTIKQPSKPKTNDNSKPKRRTPGKH